MDDAAKASAAPPGTTSDVERLHELGYAQELKRGMSGFSNFAVSFTIISILSGCLTLFGFGMAHRRADQLDVWLARWSGVMVTFVALAMGEVCSSYPTAGGLYYWSAKLAKRNGAAWSWFTGWFNMLGQVAITAGIDFGLAAIFSGFLNVAFDVVTTKIILIEIYTVVLVLHGTAQHVRRASGRAVQRRERLVARLRRPDRRAGLGVHPGSAHELLVAVQLDRQHAGADRRRDGGHRRLRELLRVRDEPRSGSSGSRRTSS